MFRKIWMHAALTAWLAGCGSGNGTMGDDPGPDDGPLQAERSDWTVFVYGHGDHNLGPSLVADIREMAAAKLDGRVNVVVLADWNASQEPFSSGTEWYRIAGGGEDPELIATGPELNLDEPEVLAEAVRLAFKNNPADHYGLIIWDHGGAWKLGFGSDTQDGTLRRPRGMAVVEAAAAIRAGLDGAGLRGDRPLDFLSFDTCLMAGVEVISEMAPLAETYIANAEIDYGAGWDYTATFSWLAAHPDASPTELARAEASAWDKHHLASGATDVMLRSHAAIDTTRWDTFVAAYADFATAFEGGGGVAVGRSLSRSLPGFELSSVVDLGNPPELRDVGQFLAFFAAGPDRDLSARAARARSALEAALIASSNGELRGAQAGVHIELPAATSIAPDLVAAYRDLAPAWADRAGWGDGLARLAAFADGEGPQLTHRVENATGPTRDALPELRFASAALDVDSADVQLGFVASDDPGSVYVLGMIATGMVAPGEENRYVWDGGSWTLPGEGGQGEQFVSVGPWARLGADASGEAIPPILQVMGMLDDGNGGTASGALLLDGENGSVPLVVVFTEAGNPAMFSLRELAGVSFTPFIPKVGLATGEITFAAGAAFPLPSAGLGVGRAQVPAGAAALFTSMTDVWGNQETVVDLVHLTQPIPE